MVLKIDMTSVIVISLFQKNSDDTIVSQPQFMQVKNVDEIIIILDLI